ncbi:GH3 auxin-responsive promoter family protein [Dyadobacter sp. CY323]|uniref:GH3 family domain-containing protein n=1 Tax=Dyadobacter sp. CY323 TaxID=2907302 RepID=UPI001F3D1ACD|nr:GH3 auxin-responsive promoter family protein [Dyadobacter sp. CY323]MCE6987918.1 GH3 auxin-responsive promoter family protein [Dyadobacter sp. CY323]
MALVGSLLKKGIHFSNIVANRRKANLHQQQKKTLAKLLAKARYTEFGEKFNFDELLSSILFGEKGAFYELYKRTVPIYDYNKIFKEWWYKSLEGEKDVCWPGQIKYYALSSGTSEASTKHIPVTKAMSRAIQKTSIRQILSLGNYKDLPDDLYEKGFLMLSGSTNLNNQDKHFEGDLSGIQAKQIPYWFRPYYKPGEKIAAQKDWGLKLEEITLQAHEWDIGFIVGVPAWVQLLMEKIIDHYKVKTIHDIWPNLRVFGHGGVSFEPYRKGFEKLLARPLIYINTYLASEGFIAYQTRPNAQGMELVCDNGLFFEFIPFNEANFDSEGSLLPNPTTLMVDQVEEGKEYALLLSTCAGAWRYLIGDTIKFVDKAKGEIAITGRTKHYLSLCGEHLSVDNMNKAVDLVSDEMGLTVKEFTVSGIEYGSMFAHQWYIGVEEENVDAELLKKKLDAKLAELNDDYAVERRHALQEVFVTVLPNEAFYAWMKSKNKMGGQHKFPRVFKNFLIDDWKGFLKNNGYIS